MHIPTPSRLSLFLLALTLLPLTSAHGKVSLITGDLGGNTTALGILGGIVPGTGANSVTEIDTTVFCNRDIASDGLGRTMHGGENEAGGLGAAMALSGGGLPVVSAVGGRVRGVFWVVTTDGAGPIQAIIDPSATGAFSVGVKAYVITNVPGKNGNIKPDGSVPRSLSGSLALGARSLAKRAANVNKGFPIDIVVPAGMQCVGSVAGESNVCFLKIANANKNGPFGGVVAFRMVGAETAVNVTARAAGAARARAFRA